MVRPGKRARLNTRILLRSPLPTGPPNVEALVVAQNSEGHRRLRFSGTADILEDLPLLGEVPLPPYIERGAGDDPAEDVARYQTVYAVSSGSVAAPTAGLHFTQELLEKIRQKGIEVCSVTLHVGTGTFAPVKADSLSEHLMHEERFHVSEKTAAALNSARKDDRRVIAVGTTSARVLESVASAQESRIIAGHGRTRLFIHPPCHFRVVEALLTNFHLPRSTLLMLVSAFAAPNETRGRDIIMSAYTEAIRERYRFFSYGDAMLIL